MDFTNFDWNKAVENTLADYERTKNSTFERTAVDLTKYFSLSLGEKESTGEKSFRILPFDEKGNWYHVAKFHSLKVGAGWVKLYDPSQDGDESPLNDMYNLLKNGTESDKNLAKQYRPKEFYIVRGIERGKEHEGVKFWRFPKVYDGTGVMDKIIPLMKRMQEKNAPVFYHPEKGRDLVISLIKASKGATSSYTKVSSIMLDDPSPIYSDAEKSMSWLNDSFTWKDAYRRRPIEYLRIVAEGGEPVWSQADNKFVSKDNITEEPVYDSTVAVNNTSEKNTIVSQPNNEVVVEPPTSKVVEPKENSLLFQEADVDDYDLPF